jgi:hypothetical protein
LTTDTRKRLNESRRRLLDPRKRLALLLLPLAGGVGLVMHVLVDVSLPLAMAVLAALGASGWWWLHRRMTPAAAQRLRRRALAGLRIGVLATVAYDVVRYGIVAVFSLSFEPFHVIPIFGHLFIGANAPESLAWIVGFAYHLSNGIGFGIAYVLLFRRPHPVTGMLWGLGLELAMATLYPAWLRITAMQEFLTVSMIGHVTYGFVLGMLARREVARREVARRELAAREVVRDGGR